MILKKNLYYNKFNTIKFLYKTIINNKRIKDSTSCLKKKEYYITSKLI